MVFKEEADTSQVCQAYDKEFAKDDKLHHRNFLDVIRFHSPMVGQMELVLVANAALNTVQPRQWRDSHDCVNLRPYTCTPFTVWIKRVQASMQTGKLFFKKRSGIFDAMPSCWKHLKESQRREVASLIGVLYEESRANP